MKFCNICGRPLQDGEVCSCQAQQNAPRPEPPRQEPPRQAYQPDAQAAGQYQQPQYQQQQQYQQPGGYQQQYQQPGGYQQQYQQPGYQNPPRPAGEDPFSKALKNLPNAVKGYFKNSGKVIEIARNKKDFLLPLFFVAAFFLTNLILSLCFFLRMRTFSYAMGLGILSGPFGNDISRIINIYLSVYSSAFTGYGSLADANAYELYTFHFGFVLLAAIIMTAVVTVLYVGLRFVTSVIFTKKAPADALIGSFIEFGFHCLPVSALMIPTILLGLITPWLIAPLLGLAAAYMVVMFVSSVINESQEYQNKFVRNIIVAVCVMLGVALVFWMLHLVCSMNYSDSMLSQTMFDRLF